MAFNLLHNLSDKDSKWTNVIFYIVCVLLLAAIACYGIFAFKEYSQKKDIEQLDIKLAEYGTAEQKMSEKTFLSYKKKIDDFATVVNNHRISSIVFSFIESKTLSSVWFSNMSVSKANNSINLSGEAESMQALSNQVNVFEQSDDYVKNIVLLSSQMSGAGTTRFTLSVALNPGMFAYNPVAPVVPSPGAPDTVVPATPATIPVVPPASANPTVPTIPVTNP